MAALSASEVARLKTQLMGTDTADFTMYLFEVVSGGMKWSVKKRYSDFVKIHSLLHRRHPTVKLPRLPPKRVLGRLSTEVVEQRSTALQIYIQELLSTPEVANSNEVMTFLEAATNYASLRLEVHDIQRRMDEINRANSETLELLRDREAENAKLTVSIEELKQGNLALTEQNRALKEELETLKPRVTEQSDRLESSYKKLIALTKSHSAKTNEFNTLMERYERLKIDLASMNAEYSELRLQLDERQRGAKEVEDECRRVENTAAERENTVIELRKRSNANLDKIQKLQDELSQHEEEARSLDESIHTVEEKLDAIDIAISRGDGAHSGSVGRSYGSSVTGSFKDHGASLGTSGGGGGGSLMAQSLAMPAASANDFRSGQISSAPQGGKADSWGGRQFASTRMSVTGAGGAGGGVGGGVGTRESTGTMSTNSSSFMSARRSSVAARPPEEAPTFFADFTSTPGQEKTKSRRFSLFGKKDKDKDNSGNRSSLSANSNSDMDSRRSVSHLDGSATGSSLNVSSGSFQGGASASDVQFRSSAFAIKPRGQGNNGNGRAREMP